MNKKRILITAALFIAILLLPYYIYAPALIVAIVLIPEYYEGILLGLLIDVLYGADSMWSLWGFPFGLTAVVCIILLVPLREKLRSYA